MSNNVLIECRAEDRLILTELILWSQVLLEHNKFHNDLKVLVTITPQGVNMALEGQFNHKIAELISGYGEILCQKKPLDVFIETPALLMELKQILDFSALKLKVNRDLQHLGENFSEEDEEFDIAAIHQEITNLHELVGKAFIKLASSELVN